jgi:hypothetical protein
MVDNRQLEAMHNKTSPVFKQPSFESLIALKKIDYTESPAFSVKSVPFSGFSGSNDCLILEILL